MFPNFRGFSLIESLISMLLISIGLIGLIAMYGKATMISGDAQYRAEAGAIAADLAQQIAGSVQRTEGVVSPTDLATYAHRAGGAPCGSTGASASHAEVTKWISRLTTTRTGLPGAGDAAFQQVRVEPGATDFNRVTITVCWRAPGETDPSRYELITHIN